jgi:hypothetical protein
VKHATAHLDLTILDNAFVLKYVGIVRNDQQISQEEKKQSSWEIDEITWQMNVRDYVCRNSTDSNVSQQVRRDT